MSPPSVPARFRRALALCALAACSATASRAQAPADTAWPALFLAAASASAEVIGWNHPGPVDDENPAFREALADAHAVAPDVAERRNDPDDSSP